MESNSVLDEEALAVLANDLLNINKAINTFLINLSMISYHAFSLNIYEY